MALLPRSGALAQTDQLILHLTEVGGLNNKELQTNRKTGIYGLRVTTWLNLGSSPNYPSDASNAEKKY